MDETVGDPIEQFLDKPRMVVKIHHQVRHAAQGPGPFVEREAHGGADDSAGAFPGRRRRNTLGV
jgi:hypothetical protein